VGIAAAAVLLLTEQPHAGALHVTPTVSSTGAGLGLDATW
jgi:hypothetical protein